MTERPILFSAEMVRAILDGRKTQTRRIIPPKWAPELTKPIARGELPHWRIYTGDGGYMSLLGADLDEQEDFCRGIARAQCRYGQPGDRLWVRETYLAWQGVSTHDVVRAGDVSIEEAMLEIIYRDNPGYDGAYQDGKNGHPWVVVPSIFMPRWASRIDLEIDRVRVERVQDISEKDAYAEGIDLAPTMPHPKAWFRDLWDSINANRGYSWDSNPWVWVVEFRRVK